jgi:serine/threonine protein kinase
METDRNLLFGVLALQAGLIDRDQFVEACTAWAARKESPLAALLADRGWINADDRTHLDYLLARTLGKHGGDAVRALAEVTTDEARHTLGRVDDVDVRRSLADAMPFTEAGGHILLSTIAYQPETRERYTLTRLHAEGGIGRVWLARDADLGRDVALKELRPERAANPAAWSRFLEEARITGQLEHPGIVPVYELARKADESKPFYTMRFVRGRTLAEASRAYHQKRAEGQAGPLDLQALLNAFVGVCNAVAYAHSRGVIHRDLKGQNVVLGDFGEVVVLDWGLAKLVDRPEQTLTPAVAVEKEAGRGETLAGQALGTPAYMAPEQAEGRWDVVDRRSDVYGLGAILYEVLTGQPPFDGIDTSEILRRVVHEHPARPRSLDPAAPPALEAVCLKALAKQPKDRYGSARELADEVRRHLADEPVTAYSEPLNQRAGRWARRHKPLVASAAALLVAAVLGLTVGTILLGQANARTEAQRRIAETNFRKARQAVDEYFTKISESRLLNVPGLQPLRKDLLESARKYYEEFLKDRGNDRTVRADAAEAWYRLGYLTMQLGSPAEAAPSLEKAAAMYEMLARDHPDEPRYPYKLAMSLNDLGITQAARGQNAEAAQSHRRAMEIREQIVRAHPTVAEYRKELAIGYANVSNRLFESGRLEGALDAARRSQAIYESLLREHPDVADYRHRLTGTYGGLAMMLHEMGRVPESLEMHRRAIAMREALVREHPVDLEFRSGLAGAYADLGFVQYRLTGELAEALAAMHRAREIVDGLARDNPTVVGYRSQLGWVHNHIGRIQEALDRPDEARTSHEQARAIRESLVREQPDVPWHRNALAYSLYYLGRLERDAGREAEAVRHLERSRALWEELSELESIDPYNRACIESLCSELAGVGKTTLSPEDLERRRRYADRAVASLRAATAGGYHNPDMIEGDSDFDAVRDREDFQVLLRSQREHRPDGAVAPRLSRVTTEPAP